MLKPSRAISGLQCALCRRPVINNQLYTYRLNVSTTQSLSSNQQRQQYRQLSIYTKLKTKSQSIRLWLLDENKRNNIINRLTKYKQLIPFIRTPLIFINPRPTTNIYKTYNLTQQLYFIIREISIWSISYTISYTIPYTLQLSSHHTYITQPIILLTIYISIILLFTNKLPPPPSGKPGLWYGILRYFRSLLLVSLFFILWNVPLVYSIKLWLGYLYSDIDNITRLMYSYDTDILNYVIIQPYIDELVYRGLLFGRLCRICGTIPAVIVVSNIYAFIHSIDIDNKSFKFKTYNDLYWFSLVFCISYRLSGRLYLPILLRCGSSFLVWTQCESISPLNDDIDSRQEMLSEVLYWLQNNNIAPLHDAKTVLNIQHKIHNDKLQNIINILFNVLDRQNKGYLTIDEFTYLFTLQPGISYILAAALNVIQATYKNADNTTNNDMPYASIYPSKSYIQLHNMQYKQLKQLASVIEILENQYNPLNKLSDVVDELIHIEQDIQLNHCSRLSKKQQNAYYTYYYELCQALMNSRVLSSLSHYNTNSDKITKQLFIDYMYQRYLYDEGAFYDIINQFIAIQLYNSVHPLQNLCNTNIK